MASGRRRAAVHLADSLAAQGGGALAWLQAQGVDLSDVRQLGGHSRPRTHRPPQAGGKPAPVGWTIISALQRRVAAVPAIETLTSARVVQLLTRREADALADTAAPVWPAAGAPAGEGHDDIDDTPLPMAPSARPEVGGVVYIDMPARGGGAGGGGGDGGATAPPSSARHAILADAVVLATGGYCAPGNPVLAAHAAAAAAGLPSTNAALATGDGVRLGGRLGAGTVDLDAVQVHPTGFGLMVHVQPGGAPVCAVPGGASTVGGDAATAAGDGDTDVLAELQRRVGLPAAAVRATLAAVAASVDGMADALQGEGAPYAKSLYL
ncbi:hypothetical protein I4F81_010605 [Pyropia yezoensis]|uniref:Uncharacterized protein n=1 Tax=Pyropia yezoensis TaxID=2788 RepID=A0ACC3CCZ6_PYRYE|nr:hypothetical protein I4F81_010605 [Neopyropia yezoensis]